MVIAALVHAGVAMRTPDRGLAARTKLRPGSELLMIALGVLAFAVDALRLQSSLPPVPGEDRRIEVPAADALRQTPLALADDAVGQRGGEAETARWIRAEVLYREALRLAKASTPSAIISSSGPARSLTHAVGPRSGVLMATPARTRVAMTTRAPAGP